ncbi:allophanate hydrolase [Mycobacterium sp.]|uniref:allophanate hydrolase n=1 Tax=Mycobacterium sp. TaxID=1785 RepID=UPI003BABF1C9
MTPTESVDAAFERLACVDRPEVWITLRDHAEVLAEASRVDSELPLAGMIFAVKDNIDVAGLPTTAGVPSYSYIPEKDAVAVGRLRTAGAVVIGKTNLDQFATGLVGTRSPYGAVRNAWDPCRISGGSSSGSAVAVALGIVDFALGTDTAGSGRVPAALNGIVGIKPTRGLIPVTGVVPACYSLDCVTVLARDLGLARFVAELMQGSDGSPMCRNASQPSPAPARPRIAVPIAAQLHGLAEGWQQAFDAAASRFASTGVEIVETDVSALLEAANLLYEGAFVAERYAAVGAHIERHPDLIGVDLDPTVCSIILGGRDKTAAQWAADTARLATLAAAGRAALHGCTALLTPTTTWHPRIADVAADPIGANARMGRFTNFANLLDLSSVAIPAGFVAGLPFGVMLTGAAFTDSTLAELAHRFARPDVDIFVVGAHLTGQPLNSQLVAAGGTLIAKTTTAPQYRLHLLETIPPKPGLVRVTDGGMSIEGEVWRLSAAGFGTFVAEVSSPMAIGKITLADGVAVSGFLVERFAIEGTADISGLGGWRGYLAGGSDGYAGPTVRR